MTHQMNYSQRIELAKVNCAFLSKSHSVKICHYGNTALMVACTEKQLELICRQLHCSGIYSEKSGTGIITGFGQYK
jgi:hypothetical protein